MKRTRTLAAVLLAVLVAVSAAGCAAEETGSPAGSSGGGTLYGTWTSSDWDSATPEQKELAVVFLVEEAAASEGGDAEVVQSIVDEAEETLTPAQYSEIEDAISNYFGTAKEGATLQDALSDVRSTISKYVALG